MISRKSKKKPSKKITAINREGGGTDEDKENHRCGQCSAIDNVFEQAQVERAIKQCKNYCAKSTHTRGFRWCCPATENRTKNHHD